MPCHASFASESSACRTRIPLHRYRCCWWWRVSGAESGLKDVDAGKEKVLVSLFFLPLLPFILFLPLPCMALCCECAAAQMSFTKTFSAWVCTTAKFSRPLVRCVRPWVTHLTWKGWRPRSETQEPIRSSVSAGAAAMSARPGLARGQTATPESRSSLRVRSSSSLSSERDRRAHCNSRNNRHRHHCRF